MRRPEIKSRAEKMLPDSLDALMGHLASFMAKAGGDTGITDDGADDDGNHEKRHNIQFEHWDRLIQNFIMKAQNKKAGADFKKFLSFNDKAKAGQTVISESSSHSKYAEWGSLLVRFVLDQIAAMIQDWFPQSATTGGSIKKAFKDFWGAHGTSPAYEEIRQRVLGHDVSMMDSNHCRLTLEFFVRLAARCCSSKIVNALREFLEANWIKDARSIHFAYVMNLYHKLASGIPPTLGWNTITAILYLILICEIDFPPPGQPFYATLRPIAILRGMAQGDDTLARFLRSLILKYELANDYAELKTEEFAGGLGAFCNHVCTPGGNPHPIAARLAVGVLTKVFSKSTKVAEKEITALRESIKDTLRNPDNKCANITQCEAEELIGTNMEAGWPEMLCRTSLDFLVSFANTKSSDIVRELKTFDIICPSGTI